MPTALPPDAAEHYHLDSYTTSAYKTCLNFEEHATTTTTAGELELMYARILGYLIIYAPSLSARHEIVKVIQSCERDFEALSELGECFFDYFIRPFKKLKLRTPAPSSYPSRPSFDQDRATMVAKITEAPKHHSQAKHQALIRDGFRCVVTGVYDETARPNVSVEEIVLARGIVNTECAHIVPDSTYFNVGANSSGDKRDHSASVLAVLKRFGYTVDNLNGEKVHSLFNVMTLHHDVHDYFDRLGFWFEKTATPNCYKIRTADPLILLLVLRPHVDRVTFTTPDAVKLPLPSPDLLALHGVCAQVAQLSGAGEYIDRIHEDMEEIGVLASDGTSSDILHHALMTRGSRGITIR